MIDGAQISVVVPAFNEERLIERTLLSIPEEVDHILVIDDASTDQTGSLAKGCKDPRIQVIERPHNGGVGAAIAEGYRAFLEQSSERSESDVCVVMAGDAQMNPEDLPRLVRPIIKDRAGYAKGNRLMTHNVTKVMPRARYLGNIVFTLLTKVASGYWHVVDSQCGYTAVSREALRRIDLSSLYPRYGFPNDLLVKLNVAGVPVADVPVDAIYGEEVSGIKVWPVLPKISWLLIRGFWWRLWHKYVVRDFHPLVLLYVFGTLCSLLGAGLALWIVWHRIRNGEAPTAATSILTALFILVGFQSVLFAMMFDMIHNQDLKVPPR